MKTKFHYVTNTATYDRLDSLLSIFIEQEIAFVNINVYVVINIFTPANRRMEL